MILFVLPRKRSHAHCAATAKSRPRVAHFYAYDKSELLAVRRTLLRFGVVLVFAGLCGVAALRFANADMVGLEIRSQHLVGDELRLVVETYRTWMPFLSHSSRTADAKGYYLAINLASKEPLTDRTQVIGPLWDVPDPRSSISFEAGANFTQEDVDAAAATPICVFDTDGTLLRFTRDKTRHVAVCDALVTTAANVSWKRQGDLKPVHDTLGPMSEDRVTTGSGRYTVMYHHGKAECFDLFTGEPKEDVWLTRCFAQARSIKDLNNIRLFLTNDLKYLVVSPMDIWNTGRELIKTFDLDGRTYKRADVGLAYARGSEKPLVFPRKMDEHAGFLAEAPHGAFSIGEKLYLFMSDETMLRLYTPNGREEIVSKATPGVHWKAIPYPQIQHAPAANELVMFESNEISAKAEANEVISVIRWDYRKNVVTRDDVPLKDIFAHRGGQLRPKSALPVK
jgi:hypothetical protein